MTRTNRVRFYTTQQFVIPIESRMSVTTVQMEHKSRCVRIVETAFVELISDGFRVGTRPPLGCDGDDVSHISVAQATASRTKGRTPPSSAWVSVSLGFQIKANQHENSRP